MRNWNSWAASPAFISRTGLEPTYEELELTPHAVRQFQQRGLEPTYEELELGGERRLILPFFGLEPTYEELEHRIFAVMALAKQQFGAYL